MSVRLSLLYRALSMLLKQFVKASYSSMQRGLAMSGHASGGVSGSRYSSFKSAVFCAVAKFNCKVYVCAAVPGIEIDLLLCI